MALFGKQRALIGMIHIGALPGTAASKLSPGGLIDQVVEEARLLTRAGFDAILLENTHDTPYLARRVGPEVVAMLAVLLREVRHVTPLPLGLQVLAGCNHEALAIAFAAGASFIRAEGFVFASVADEGLLFEADAGPLLRYRRSIGAESVQIFCDIKKKHSSHAITSDVGLAETARAAEFFRADGVIVTGVSTGSPTDPGDVEMTRAATDLPVLVGSGVTPDNMGALLKFADGLIVGSWFKREGRWQNPPDEGRIGILVDTFQRELARL